MRIKYTQKIKNTVSALNQPVEVKRKCGRPMIDLTIIPIPKNSDPIRLKQIKNNEASKRSRQRRKELELTLEVELRQLEQKNKELLEKKAKLDMEIHMWSSYILKLNDPVTKIHSIERCQNQSQKFISINKS